MKRLRKPPINKTVRDRFIEKRPRIVRGKFATVITVYGKGQQLRITLLSTNRNDNVEEVRYYTRLIGNAYVMYDENSEAEFMPPYYGRQFTTRQELTALMEEMLAAFIMLHA